MAAIMMVVMVTPWQIMVTWRMVMAPLIPGMVAAPRALCLR